MSLDPIRFTLNETANQNWTLTAEAGTVLEDVLRPDYLSNVAARLHPYDHIRVRVDTGEWYAELLVLTCGRAWAKTAVLYSKDLVNRELEEIESEAFDQFYVKYNGPHLKWCVIRKNDRETVKNELESKQEAQSWLSAYLLAL